MGAITSSQKIKLGTTYPNTERITDRITEYENMGILFPYECKEKCDFTSIYETVNRNKKFGDVPRDKIVSVLSSLETDQDDNCLKQVDYVLITHGPYSNPVLCLKNTSAPRTPEGSHTKFRSYEIR